MFLSLILRDRVPAEPEVTDEQTARYNLRANEKVYSRVKPAHTEWIVVETLQIPELNCRHARCECDRYRTAAQTRLLTTRAHRLMQVPRERLMIIGTGNDPREGFKEDNRSYRRRYDRLLKTILRKLTRANRGRQASVDAALQAEFAKREQAIVLPNDWRERERAS